MCTFEHNKLCVLVYLNVKKNYVELTLWEVDLVEPCERALCSRKYTSHMLEYITLQETKSSSVDTLVTTQSSSCSSGALYAV